MPPRHILEAAQSWRVGRLGAVGYLLYENLPVEQRPVWAAGVLQFCCDVVGKPPKEVRALIEISRSPHTWQEAKPAFRAVRLLTLTAFQTEPKAESVNSRLLYLSESVAKVIYGASGGPEPFDSDAGWWIPQRAVELVERSEQDIYDALWDALVWPWPR